MFSLVGKMKSRFLIAILMFLNGSLSIGASEVVLAWTDYPPYYGSNLENGGPVGEIIVQAYKQAGYAVKLDSVPWARGIAGSKRGRYDGIFFAWYRKEREQWFVFSAPLATNEIGFYKRKGEHIKFDSLEDLRPWLVEYK